jgi:hypothetical protein
MLGFIRFFIIGMIALTVLYILLGIYVRSLTRERLEEEWASENEASLEEGSNAARDDYVEAGMQDYAGSIRPKLLLGVYILPMITFCVVFYMTNIM